MPIDLTSVANILLSLASAAILAAVPIVVPAALKRLGVANNADLSAKLTTAADAAAGEAYRFALAHEGGLANVGIHDAALAVGTQYVVSRFPDAMKALGVTPENVEAMVTARLGALLAGDPTVSAGKPVVTPAVTRPQIPTQTQLNPAGPVGPLVGGAP